jgi:type II secretory pathway component PulJ
MKRSGSTLIELAISLPIFSMLMVLAVGVVHQTMRISRLAKERGQLALSLAKLEQTVRMDVHQSLSATVQQDEKTGLLSLHLVQPDESRIAYHCRSNRIERQQTNTNAKSHFDSFALFAENKVLFEVEENRRVLVSVHRVHRDHASADRLELLVRSVIGRPQLAANAPIGGADE